MTYWVGVLSNINMLYDCRILVPNLFRVNGITNAN